jgi:hypothetical protein
MCTDPKVGVHFEVGAFFNVHRFGCVPPCWRHNGQKWTEMDLKWTEMEFSNGHRNMDGPERGGHRNADGPESRGAL